MELGNENSARNIILRNCNTGDGVMYDKLEGHSEYQEFLAALLTLKLCQVFGGKLHVCAKRMKYHFTDENTLKFLKRVNKSLLDYTFKEFQESFE